MLNTDALVAVLQKIRESARKDRNDDICREKYDALTATFHEYEWSAMREGNIYIYMIGSTFCRWMLTYTPNGYEPDPKISR